MVALIRFLALLITEFLVIISCPKNLKALAVQKVIVFVKKLGKDAVLKAYGFVLYDDNALL